MKKLLYQFDTDPLPAVFDNVVGYDGGADHITAYGGVTAAQRRRPGGRRHFHARPEGQEKHGHFHRRRQHGRRPGAARRRSDQILRQISRLGDVRLQRLEHHGRGGGGVARSRPLARRQARRGARRHRSRRPARCGVARARRRDRGDHRPQARGRASGLRFDQGALRLPTSRPIEAPTHVERGAAIEGAHIVLATGAAGVTLLDAEQWQDSPTLELIADANASPPAGIEGVAMSDRGTKSHGKILFGALGFGALKLAAAPRLHRAPVRAERSGARRRGDLRDRQDDGRLNTSFP